MTSMKLDETARQRTMQRLAAALGIPLEAFDSDNPTAGAVAQTEETFRLWSMLNSTVTREELLDRARETVKLERDKLPVR